MGIFSFNRSENSHLWLKLDNAAKIFPAVTNSTRTSVFRLSVDLTEPVNLSCLEKAIRITMNDMPYFQSHLRKGFFWYWLEPSTASLKIQPDDQAPCRTFSMQKRNHLLIRVLARNNTISTEFSHILTDGGGGMQFLQKLLFEYGRLKEWAIPAPEDAGILSVQTPEVLEDGYVKFFKKKYPKPHKISHAFHLPFAVGRKIHFSTITAELSVKEVLERSRSREISMTEYLASVYLYSLQKSYLKEQRESSRRGKSVLRVQIPVNLRGIYQSNTLRNFALFVMPEIDPRFGAYSFDEIAATVHHYMQLETNVRQIQRIIARNVGGEKNPLIRIVPLLLKIPILILLFNNSGPLLYSGVLTNLGAVKLHNSLDNYIQGFRFIAPPPDPRIRINGALVSYKDRLILSFGNQTTNTSFERDFFKFLVEDKIHVKILKN